MISSIDFDTIMDCESIAASTEEILWSDDDTIVAEQEHVWHEDLAAIRRLLDAETGNQNCPSCAMPFDKGKKRRLIDNCGHERCYSCMFTNETCPLCHPGSMILQKNNYLSPGIQSELPTTPLMQRKLGNSSLRGSEITLYGEIAPTMQASMSGSISSNSGGSSSRTKVKTNGHFTTYMQSRDLNTSIEMAHPEKLPKTRPSNAKNTVMTQSCPTPPQSRRRYFLSPKTLRSPFVQRASSRQTSADSAFSDDDCTNEKPPTKKSSEDMYMRLGLLLGDGARRSKRGGGPGVDSCSSLASYDTGAAMSTNTSPVSTLTGSSEDQMQMRAAGSDSVGSLMSMSMSGQSNCSSSPMISRRHSVTNGPVDDLAVFQTRRTCARRSARTAKEQSKTLSLEQPRPTRLNQYRPPQLTLKPLFFEVPLQEPDPLFLGRQWLIKEISEMVGHSTSGVLLSGNPGTGKTALILQLVEHSCFGRRKESLYQSVQPVQNLDAIERIHSPERSRSPLYYQVDSPDKLRQLANQVVAYHFCQADNNNTCLVPDFIHSLAAQLCQAPTLTAYRDHLLNEPHLQGALSLRECIVNPDLSFCRGILEPLSSLRRIGKIDTPNCVILVDGLCEAEYHRPDHGDTITSFLAKHIGQFPSWLKVVATVRTQLSDVAKQLPFTRISLDNVINNEHLQRDILEYVSFRLQNSPSIQSNTTATNVVKVELNQHKFCQHLLTLSHGSFLFAKLTLDLLERGHLVAKSSGFKVLPVSLAQIFLLHFNLRFPTVRSFEKVTHILSVCLAALYPLTLVEIYYSVNALLVDSFLPWSEFLQRFKLLSGFLVKRLDNTYMFFHPSFREWLIRRDDNESPKFLCDLRAGHCGIAFRLSRVQAPLDSEKTLELGHHILKAHVYRNMTLGELNSRDLQAFWLTQTSMDVSDGVSNLRNIYSPNVKVSRLLLLAGADPNHVTDYLGNAPILCMYANEGIQPMISLLLEFGADVDLTNNQGCAALSLAAAKGHGDVVRLLIGAGANPGNADTAGHCALIHAARNGHLNVMGYLLGAEWSSSKAEEETHRTAETISLKEAAQQALVAAAGQGHCQIVEYLLDLPSVDIDTACSLTGETALTIASGNGCLDVVSLLLEQGASLSCTNKKEMTPLLLAVKEGHYSIVELFAEKNINLEQCDNQGKSPLMLAASEGQTLLVELFFDKGASLEKEDAEGLTALCWACLRGKQNTCAQLLDRNANLNHTDKTGRTPLDLAAFQGNPAIVQLLLEKGAIIEHVDNNGMRPLDRAIGCRNIQVVQCFLKKGAKLGPATWAMAQGKPDIMLILLNKLLEDGNLLYRKSRLREAAHRYQYALKKFPVDDETAFRQLKYNFLLNHSRCKRKLNEYQEAIDMANQALEMKSDSYEAFYARAKAFLDSGASEKALADVKDALRFVATHRPDVRKVLLHLKEEIQKTVNALNKSPQRIISNREFAISVDTLHE